VGEESKHRHLV